MTRKQRILIVDDDADLLKMLTLILSKGGYEVIKAENGIDGLAKAEEHRPDLIVLDVMMPLVDGFVVCRRLRANPVTRHLPIIMLSALERVDDKVKGFEAGADDYVPKPVDGKELLARVNALLQRASAVRTPATYTVAITGAKGGVGATSVAVNIAIALAKQGKSVILAEIRDSYGSVRHQLKLQSELNLASLLASEAVELKRSEILRRVVNHSSGLRLLLAPQTTAGSPFSSDHIDAILEALSYGTDYLILDLPATLDEGGRRALELSEQILLVTEPEHLSIACARVQLAQFKAWEVYERTDLVIVSRSASTMGLNRVEVENHLGMAGGEHQAAAHWETRALEVDVRLRQGVAAVIPPAPELFFESMREGVPIILIEPSAGAAGALLDLVEWLSEKDLSPAVEERPIRYIE